MTQQVEQKRREQIQAIIDLLVHPDPVMRERYERAVDNFIAKQQSHYHKDDYGTIAIRIRERDEYDAFGNGRKISVKK